MRYSANLAKMEYSVDQQTLDFIWEALNETNFRRPSTFRALNIFKKNIAKGWTFRSDLEDILDCLDWRLQTYRFDVVKLSEALEVNWELVSFRPKAISRFVSEYQATRVENVALLLILLERLGFQTEPSEFVNLLLPSVKSKKKMIFSNAELEIFWFEKCRHKHAGISLITESGDEIIQSLGSVNTQGGYRITLKGDEAGNARMLKVASPKFRKQARPVLVNCPECGLDWYKGDPESSLAHRKKHKEIMKYLDPVPSMDLLQEKTISANPEWVDASSSKWKHKEMYVRARAFKREMGYDFIQWNDPDSLADPNAIGYLFTNVEGAIVGACSFYNRSEDYGRNIFGLQWIWICPRERRKGHLSLRWKMFRERFGHFVVESPVSDEMQRFLTKFGDSALMYYPK